MRTWKLQSALWVPHKPHQVFPFFADAQKLELLTPPWLCFQIKTPMPIEMRVGALIDYRISLRGIPMKWRTRIARWEPDVAYVSFMVPVQVSFGSIEVLTPLRPTLACNPVLSSLGQMKKPPMPSGWRRCVKPASLGVRSTSS